MRLELEIHYYFIFLRKCQSQFRYNLEELVYVQIMIIVPMFCCVFFCIFIRELLFCLFKFVYVNQLNLAFYFIIYLSFLYNNLSIFLVFLGFYLHVTFWLYFFWIILKHSCSTLYLNKEKQLMSCIKQWFCKAVYNSNIMLQKVIYIHRMFS